MLTGLDARDLVDSSRAGGGVGVGHRRAVWMDGRQAWINWWGGMLGPPCFVAGKSSSSLQV